MDGNEVKAIAEGNYLLESCIAFNSVLSELSQNGKNIKLAYTESKTLLLLIQHVGEIVSREQITEYSWSGRIVTDSSLAKSISNVRKALRELGLEDDVIITVPRIGYRLICKVIKMEESICQDNIELLASENEFNDLDKKNEQYIESSMASPSKCHYNKPKKLLWNLPITVKVVILLTSFGMIGYSAYNFIWRIERDLDKAYLAKGYEINQLAISGRNYQIIKPENVLLTEYFKSIIALAPENSVVFIQKNNNVYNVSYLARGKSSSFTFAEVDKDTVKCKIREILYEGGGICGM